MWTCQISSTKWTNYAREQKDKLRVTTLQPESVPSVTKSVDFLNEQAVCNDVVLFTMKDLQADRSSNMNILFNYNAPIFSIYRYIDI